MAEMDDISLSPVEHPFARSSRCPFIEVAVFSDNPGTLLDVALYPQKKMWWLRNFLADTKLALYLDIVDTLYNKAAVRAYLTMEVHHDWGTRLSNESVNSTGHVIDDISKVGEELAKIFKELLNAYSSWGVQQEMLYDTTIISVKLHVVEVNDNYFDFRDIGVVTQHRHQAPRHDVPNELEGVRKRNAERKMEGEPPFKLSRTDSVDMMRQFL